MRIVLIGDVGPVDDVIHLGDEAMTEAAINELRSRGIDDITVVSANPIDTAERYSVKAVHRLGFGSAVASGHEARLDRLARIESAATGTTGMVSWDDPAWEVIEAVAAADAVVIAGGGNLMSSWPEHIFERVAIGRIARVFAKPFVVTGQTVGPTLIEGENRLVAELLGGAALVGIREDYSLAVVASLGVDLARVSRTIDDAAFLGFGSDTLHNGDAPQEYCIATFASHIGDVEVDDFASAAASLVTHLASATGLVVILVAHEFSLKADERARETEGWPAEHAVGDSALHALIAQKAASNRVRSRSVSTAVEAAQLARGAAFSVATRYHSTVFSTSAGVPSLGISLDDYTDSKISGALVNAGQGDHLAPFTALFTGDAQLAIDQLWSERDEIRRVGEALGLRQRKVASQWWDDVAAALHGEKVSVRAWQRPASKQRLDPRLRKRLDGLTTVLRSHSQSARTARIVILRLDAAAAALAARVDDLAIQLAQATMAAAEASRREASSTRALEAAHNLTAALGDPDFLVANLAEQTARYEREKNVADAALALSAAELHRMHLQFERVNSLANDANAELARVRATRTYRWSRIPRRVYSALRGHR
jgi:polysaccharide pyruvyl transferase WcaK-like protein